jgi:hypothetical protein
MAHSALDLFIERTRAAWGPLSSELVSAVRTQLAELTRAPIAEPWLATLLEEAPAAKELYRDPTHGFVLLAHSEPSALYRPPHDHGGAWVVYALQQGEMEIGTYGRVHHPDGTVRLVQRDVSTLRRGEARVYLPSDIHDTRCIGGTSLLLRFTERDLKKQEPQAQQVARYVQRDGLWTLGPT